MQVQKLSFAPYVLALAFALSAVQAAHSETYYYVGGAAPASFAAAENWATEVGEVCLSDPDITAAGGNTFIFTNDATVAFSTAESIAAPIVKRGSGMVVFYGSGDLTLDSRLVLEKGTFAHGYNSTGYTTVSGKLILGNDFALDVRGGDSKGLYLYSNGGNNTHRNVTIPHYLETAEAEGTMTFTAFGSLVKTYKFKGDENTVTRFSAVMDPQSISSGNTFVFDWTPGYSSSVLEVVGRNYSQGKGEFKVSSGVLRFAKGSGVTSLANITVESGAKLEIGEDVATDVIGGSTTTFGCSITVAAGGKLKISCGILKPTSVTYNGVALLDGRYDKSSYDWIEGDGLLEIGDGGTVPEEPATTEATWTGDVDTDVTNPGNWQGGLPDLETGSLVASFPTGAGFTVPSGTTASFKGIVVTSPSFTISGSADSVMKIGSAGIVATNADAAASFTISCPTVLTRSQTWIADEDGTFDLAISGSVSAEWPYMYMNTLTMSGGVYRIYSSNPSLCNVKYYTTIDAYADCPLGGRFVTAEAMVDGKVVKCHGNVFSNNFYCTKVTQHAPNHDNLVLICSGTNVFNGVFHVMNNNGDFWWFEDSADGRTAIAKFTGGYVMTGTAINYYTHFSPVHSGTIVIEDVPMDNTRMYVGYPVDKKEYGNSLYLNVPLNTTTRGIHVFYDSVLNTTVENALYATDDGSSGVLLNEGATWNLSADQGVNVFAGVGATAVVNSENGATLHLRDDRLNTVKADAPSTITVNGRTEHISLVGSKAQTNKVCFAGNVSFSKEGVLDHWMEGVSTSTGSITVKKGKLIFTSGSWQNASGVTVSDTGKLEIRSRTALGKETPLSFVGASTDGMLVIPSGVTVRVYEAYVNGAKLTGRYTSGLVTGGGTLVVAKPGFSVNFR